MAAASCNHIAETSSLNGLDPEPGGAQFVDHVLRGAARPCQQKIRVEQAGWLNAWMTGFVE